MSKAASGVPRARMFIKVHLAWMDGYPIGIGDGVIRWQRLNEPEAIEIDGGRLRQATYTMTKLRNRFPRALPKLVGDVRAWEAGRRALLELLKPTVHRGEALPGSLFAIDEIYDTRDRRAAARLSQHCPALDPVLAALSWSCATAPTRARKLLGWLTRNYVELGELVSLADEHADTTRLVLGLCRLLERDGAKRVTPLLDRLADARLYNLPIGVSSRHKQDIQNLVSRSPQQTSDVETSPGGELMSTRVMPWLESVLAMEETARRRAVRLFVSSWPEDEVAAWQRWWAKRDRVVRSVRRALGPTKPRQLPGSTRQKLQEKLNAVVDSTPTEIPMAQWLQAIDGLSDQLDDREFRLLARLLAKVPGPVVSRAMILVDVHRMDEDTRANLHPVLAALSRYLSDPDFDEEWMQPWYPLAGWGRGWCDSINESAAEAEVPPRVFFDALAQAQRALGPIGIEHANRLLRLVTATQDTERSLAYLAAIVDSKVADSWMPEDARKATHLLADGDGAAFVELLKAWERIEGEYTETDAEGLFAAVELFVKRQRAGQLRSVALQGQYKRIADAGILVGLARTGKISIPDPPLPVKRRRLPPWADHYPRELRGPVRVLFDCHRDPKTAADRILGRDFPRPDRMRTEIESLQTRLANADPDRAASMRARIANLRKRLRSPKKASAVRLERLAGKLHASAALALFDDWAEAVDQQIRRDLPRKLPIRAEWLDRPGVRDVLVGVGKLAPKHRALARAVLKVRCGDPPWDLRDHPANRAFLDTLEASGVRTSPWVDGLAPLRRVRNKRPVVIAFEDDPLEVFRMGAHFRTCLRPGAMNFFSVFANAADINKRVVYARVGDTVVGRCLLALSTHGYIVSFQAYCHDQRIGFSEIIAEICTTLAEQMGTQIVANAPVPELVAKAWYDDGAVALPGTIDHLALGSDFRSSLAQIEVAAFAPALAAAVEPRGLDEQVLDTVLHFHELTHRPELVLPLLAHIDRVDALPDATMVRAAVLAKRAGQYEAARRLAGKRLVPVLRRWHREQDWMDSETLELLAELDPSGTLRLLRSTRQRGVRKWEDEPFWHRAYVAARCLDWLRRPKQAVRAYQRVLDLGVSGAQRRYAEERIADLQRR